MMGPSRALHPDEAKFTYGCASPIDNLHIIFGTRNFIKMLLPVSRPLPLTGLEWTALKIKNMYGASATEAEATEQTRLKADDDETAELRNIEIEANELS